MIVTIDGPAGSGKSTVARLLAEQLHVRFLDTGAMYRGIALAVVRSKESETDQPAVGRIAEETLLNFQGESLCIGDEDVSEKIRSAEVTAISSVIATNPMVRDRLVRLQRAIGNQGSLVTEGRDQGSVVFPNAEFKFFLTASVDARARRRHREMVAKGSKLKLATVRKQLRQRDERDENREVAPMKPAEDAQVIDTSDLSIAEVVQKLVTLVNE